MFNILSNHNKRVVESERVGRLQFLALLAFLILSAANIAVFAQGETKRFAVIGDYGSGDANEASVANLVKSWNPDFIITVGDNNYPDGEAATIDENIGQFYHEFIFPYTGTYGTGATTNKFFPTLGNHDWDNTIGAPAQPYLDYFTLPNNERYYDFVQGPVHFFALDSDSREPDGKSSTSIQAQWLQARLAASTAQWKIVYFHHSPYSSRSSTTDMQWPFQQWGATAVIAGHSHVYERVMLNGFPYFTNGLGGESTGTFFTPIPGSVVRFGSDYGAQLVNASNTSINFQFITRTGSLIDSYTISIGSVNAPTNLSATGATTNQINLAWNDNSDNESGFAIERCQNSGCTNFVGIATTGTNVTTFNDTGVIQNTTYVYRVRAFNVGSNSDYTNTFQRTTAPGGVVIMSDNFNDNLRDSSKWNLGLLTLPSSQNDSLVVVQEQNQRLEIFPRSNISGDHYRGFTSLSGWDVTDSSFAVELTQKSSGKSTTIFGVGIDSDNWYRFRIRNGKIYFENRVVGVTSGINIPYSSTSHRHLRIRHIPANETIVFETSTNGTSWTSRRTIQRQISISALKIDLIAGTSESVSAPGSARFDNFRIESASGVAPSVNPPTGLLANAISPSQLGISWNDNSSNEDIFKIERCQNTGCTNFVQVATVGANSLTFNDVGLMADTTYRYRVRAFNTSTDSLYSNVAAATTQPLPLQPPIAPSALSATAISPTQINLHWTVNSANEDGFKIERCQNSGCVNFVEVGQVGIDVEVFSDSSLTSETTYRYRVYAYNSAGNSLYSNSDEATTLSSVAPAAPSDLAANAVSFTQISLSWTDNSANESGFKIERCQDAACVNFLQIAEVGANVTILNDTNLQPSTTYRYQVRATNLIGDSLYTNIAEATTPTPVPPSAPTDLAAVSISPFQINLSWTDNSGNEDGFRIERCDTAACTNFVEIGQVNANVTSYSDIIVLPSTTYRYQIRAFQVSSNSNYSNIAESTTPGLSPPNAPGNLSATATSSTEINLAWTDNSSDEEGFKIERCQNSGCTNFLEVAQVGPNVIAYTDANLSASTLYRYRVAAFKTLDGNSPYTDVAESTTTTFLMLIDDFNDNVRDAAKWNIGIFSRSASNFDPLIVVAEENARLNITPRDSFATASYNGYVSTTTWDFNDSKVRVEVVQKASGSAVTKLSIGIDKDNWYCLRAASNSLFLEYRALAVTNYITISYNATQHRYWGIRHDPSTDSVILETSPDGTIWTTQRTLARAFSLAAVRAEMIAGTNSAVAAPSSAIFDNFRLAPNAAP